MVLQATPKRTLAAMIATAKPATPLATAALVVATGTVVLEVPDGTGVVVAEERREVETAGAEL